MINFERTEVDRSWFRGARMRSSESRRVIFHGSSVLSERGALVREPCFRRDAIRAAVSWAGIADRAVEATLPALAPSSAELRSAVACG
ncbi:MAG: hypothetical protein M3N18_09375, partial [Actinomycetota bacterium]|nr:hypothetical protein [Actinomycetota bacterium]